LKTLKVTVIREPVVRVYQRLRHHLRAAEVNQFSAEFSVATITIAVGMVVVTLVVVPTGFIPIVNCLRVETCKWVVFSAPIAISGSAFRQTDFLGYFDTACDKQPTGYDRNRQSRSHNPRWGESVFEPHSAPTCLMAS